MISLVKSAADTLGPQGVPACIAQHTLLQQTSLYSSVCLGVYNVLSAGQNTETQKNCLSDDYD